MKRLLLFGALITLCGHLSIVYGQGCVAIRGGSTCNGLSGNTLNLNSGEFSVGLGYRYFKSFRHYRGDVQEVHRLKEGTEVINKSTFVDLSVNYGFTERLFASAILPFVAHHRSSMYEHGGNPPNGLGERHSTSSKGISDIRMGLGYWLFDPSKHKYNYAVGLGVKLPSGNYKYTDTFYNQGEARSENLETVVDQSIQPGDGGTGITLDFVGYHPLSHRLGLTANLFYLFNVQEDNGVATRNGRSTFSCPDQYAVRLGLNYNAMNGWFLSFNGRLEGVTATDVLGGSAGYRRPGYAVSLEPGIGYTSGGYTVFASLPVAVYRNRIQSYEDKERTRETGVYRHGDAAFADYLINIGVSYRFGYKQSNEEFLPVFDDVTPN